MSETEKEAVLIALDVAYGKRKNPDKSHGWESNDSGLSDQELDILVDKIEKGVI